jgi:predicted nucleic acid-binding protein
LILDTNALSALADSPTVFDAIAAHVDTFSLPVIVLGEFWFGVMRSRHRARYEGWLAKLVDASRILVVDRDTAREYAAIREQLRARGRPIPSNDVWIAALGLQHRLPVLSRDAHFDEVAGLRRVGW